MWSIKYEENVLDSDLPEMMTILEGIKFAKDIGVRMR